MGASARTSVFDRLAAPARRALGRRRQPRWTAPMLATLTDRPFSDRDWLYERKLDGMRCLAFRTSRGVRLRSRNRQDQNAVYPELVAALAAQPPADFIVDGEIVAFEGGVTSFARLQRRMQVRRPAAGRGRVAVFFYVFDLLHLSGRDTSRLPLRDRKRLLRAALTFTDPVRFTPHRNTHGERFLRAACRRGWEGLIAKRADAPYRHRRSTDWLKFKCVHQQELVVGGYTDPAGHRHGFGALLVGYVDRGALRYAGKVGTGFDEAALADLSRRLKRLERTRSPFAGDHMPATGVHWVRPSLVAEIGFTEWTRAGRLRHPRFLGLRHDKPWREVVRERPRSR